MITAEEAVGLTLVGTTLATIVSLIVLEVWQRRGRRRAATRRATASHLRPAPQPRTRQQTRPVVVKEVRVNAFGELEVFEWVREAGPPEGPKVNDFGELV